MLKYLGAHWKSRAKHEEAKSDCENPSMFHQSVGPVVDDAGHQSLDVAKFRINSQNLQRVEKVIKGTTLIFKCLLYLFNRN